MNSACRAVLVSYPMRAARHRRDEWDALQKRTVPRQWKRGARGRTAGSSSARRRRGCGEGKIHRVGPDFGSTLTVSNRDSQSSCWVKLKIMGQPCEFQVREKNFRQSLLRKREQNLYFRIGTRAWTRKNRAVSIRSTTGVCRQ